MSTLATDPAPLDVRLEARNAARRNGSGPFTTADLDCAIDAAYAAGLSRSAPPPGDVGEAVERVRSARELHYSDCDRLRIYDYGDRTGDCNCTAGADLRTLLAAVSLERQRADKMFSAAMFGVDAGSVVQWGVGMGDEDVSYVFSDEEKMLALERLTHPQARLYRRIVGPWEGVG